MIKNLKSFIGTKVINATPMTHGDFQRLLERSIDPSKKHSEGYLVEYPDGGYPNEPFLSPYYVSWSPKDVFERSYIELKVNGLDFGQALAVLKSGKRVAREGWNGKNMWLALVRGPAWRVDTIANGPGPAPGTTLPWIGMLTADGGFVPWLPSQMDLLAADWIILE